jgi:hypothetical protein
MHLSFGRFIILTDTRRLATSPLIARGIARRIAGAPDQTTPAREQVVPAFD